MIAERLRFKWNVNESGVEFLVEQNPMHILCEKYYSQGKLPPLNERVDLLRRAGTPETTLKRIIKTHLQWKKDSEKHQKVIDDIFLKFNVKPTKKKVFKAVKKNSTVIKE
jgi:hypothetical protein